MKRSICALCIGRLGICYRDKGAGEIIGCGKLSREAGGVRMAGWDLEGQELVRRYCLVVPVVVIAVVPVVMTPQSDTGRWLSFATSP
jgi:hypothetical protein